MHSLCYQDPLLLTKSTRHTAAQIRVNRCIQLPYLAGRLWVTILCLSSTAALASGCHRSNQLASDANASLDFVKHALHPS